jgi:lipopolysaccharide biosynthesis glycosyltransferase
VNIVCTIDEGYAQHCGVMLQSLFTNNPGVTFTVFLLTDGLSESSRERLDAVARGFGQHIQRDDIDPAVLRHAPVDGHVSLATYFRLLIPQLLPAGVHKALFLDSDLIVRGGVTELYEQPIDGYPVAAVANPFGVREMDRLGIPRSAGYFNAGVLLLNLRRWRDEDISGQALRYIAERRDRLRWWDQDALNATVRGRWLRCPPTWNAQEAVFRAHQPFDLHASSEELREARANPRIVHFAGSSKPWHYGHEHPFTGEYYRYLADTPWKGYRPAGRPSARTRARLLAARIAPEPLRRGYRKLAAALRSDEPTSAAAVK